MLPIAQTDNMCEKCHMPDVAAAAGATPIPKSTSQTLIQGKTLETLWTAKRYNCMQCHVIQTTITPPIRNLSKASSGTRKTNLSQIY